MKVSVVTINYNSGEGFQRTHASVKAQTYPQLEWIVIDGLSTDESAAAVRTAASDASVLVIEKDGGIVDAFNKGIDRATGEAIVFMNAGDTFSSPQALEQMVDTWNRDAYTWMCGGAHFIQGDGVAYTRDISGLPVDALVGRGCRIVHPSVIMQTALLRSFSGYDPRYRSAMDFDLWVRLIARGFVPQRSPLISSNFHLGGASDTYSGFAEEIRSLSENRLVSARALRWMKLRKALVSRLGGLKRYPWAYRLKERVFR